MPRPGLTRERIARTAAELADEVGLDSVTVSGVAQRLGVSGPAMYKHVAGLDALRRDIAVLAVGELATALGDAAVGRARADALAGVAGAYRAYGRAHPGRLAASVRAPAPGDDEHAAVSNRALEVLTAVLRGYGIGEADMVDALRTVRAVLHGWTVLEVSGGFSLPQDVDATYERYVAGLDAALRAFVG